jgi:hypothetical protein
MAIYIYICRELHIRVNSNGIELKERRGDEVILHLFVSCGCKYYTACKVRYELAKPALSV